MGSLAARTHVASRSPCPIGGGAGRSRKLLDYGLQVSEKGSGLWGSLDEVFGREKKRRNLQDVAHTRVSTFSEQSASCVPHKPFLSSARLILASLGVTPLLLFGVDMARTMIMRRHSPIQIQTEIGGYLSHVKGSFIAVDLKRRILT